MTQCKCSMVAAAADVLKKHLDADDRTFILHANSVDGTAKADLATWPYLMKLTKSVSGRTQS